MLLRAASFRERHWKSSATLGLCGSWLQLHGFLSMGLRLAACCPCASVCCCRTPRFGRVRVASEDSEWLAVGGVFRLHGTLPVDARVPARSQEHHLKVGSEEEGLLDGTERKKLSNLAMWNCKQGIGRFDQGSRGRRQSLYSVQGEWSEMAGSSLGRQTGPTSAANHQRPAGQ